MKKIIIAFTLALCAISSIAQSIKIIEPEFSGIMVYVNDTIGSGVRLEQQAGSIKTKANGASYIPLVGLAAGKAKSKNVINGCCSPVKIDRNTKVQFIIKVKDNTIDPTTLINIFKLTVEKDTRIVELASASLVGGSKAGNITFIPFNAKKYGTSSYLIEVDYFESGEYAMTLPERRDLFNMFSVK
jgi:hypothetical protein